MIGKIEFVLNCTLKDYAASLNMDYFETSAKNASNLEETLLFIATKLIDKDD